MDFSLYFFKFSAIFQQSVVFAALLKGTCRFLKKCRPSAALGIFLAVWTLPNLLGQMPCCPGNAANVLWQLPHGR